MQLAAASERRLRACGLFLDVAIKRIRPILLTIIHS